jgi:hypothetical protein
VRREAEVNYLRSSNWFYRKANFIAVQLVWADGSGRFPWEFGSNETLTPLQPDLSERGWMREVERALNGS